MWWSKKKQVSSAEGMEAATEVREEAFRGLRFMSELSELLGKEENLPERLLKESSAVWRNAMVMLIHQTHIKLNHKNYTSLAAYTATILCLGYLLCCKEQVKGKVKDGSP